MIPYELVNLFSYTIRLYVSVIIRCIPRYVRFILYRGRLFASL